MFARLVDAYPEDVLIVYRHFPLNSIHANAQKAAEASEAAGTQGMFWEYHDLLFERMGNWSNLDQDAARDYFIGLADELGLDAAQFTQELDDGVYAAYVSALETEAIGLGMPGTPSVILNGRLLDGVPQDYDAWFQGVGQLIEFEEAMAALEDQQYDAPPDMTIDTAAAYQATILLEDGSEVVIDLFADLAPETVNNFVFLAEEGWYDGISFHRVIPGFMAQTGDPTGIGIGGPGYTIPDEFGDGLSHQGAGVVSMANSGPNTGGSQFFITYADATHLDGAHAIFGQVVSGMEFVEAIPPRDPADPNAPEGVKIETITIETDG